MQADALGVGALCREQGSGSSGVPERSLASRHARVQRCGDQRVRKRALTAVLEQPRGPQCIGSPRGALRLEPGKPRGVAHRGARSEHSDRARQRVGAR
jgi:hypothetical protein